jgi:hypothetical protein
MYVAWTIMAFLSLCLGLPALAVGTLASQLLLHTFDLLWLSDAIIGPFGGAVLAALVGGVLLVGSAVSIVQGFILRRELLVPIRSWGAWFICTTIGWSSGLCGAVIASFALDRYAYQTLDEALAPLFVGSLIGLGGGFIVAVCSGSSCAMLPAMPGFGYLLQLSVG